MSISYSATAMPAANLLQPSEILYNFVPPYQRMSSPHAVHGSAVARVSITACSTLGTRSCVEDD